MFRTDDDLGCSQAQVIPDDGTVTWQFHDMLKSLLHNRCNLNLNLEWNAL